MSDYGDDYSDYGEDFYYVEDDYTTADDLAEHAIGSPPPAAHGDEDAIEDWDRFDYFNDLEYASDGYDDVNLVPDGTEPAKTGKKRKRIPSADRDRKKQKMTDGCGASGPAVMELQPVVWRTQAERDCKPKIWDGNTESYALMKDWRKRHAATPAWAAVSPFLDNEGISPSKTAKGAVVPELLPPVPTYEDENEDEDEDFEDVDVEEDEESKEDVSIDPTVLLQALQNRLAEAGGPLAGMDPQQMLQFAMRMMTNQDSGDDIAGELADQMLGVQEGENDEVDEDEHEEAPDGLLSWLDKQRISDQNSKATPPGSPEINLTSKRPPTPPASEVNRSICAAEETKKQAKDRNDTAPQNKHSLKVTSTTKVTRKRKADDDLADHSDSTITAKKQATGSYDAPTAASQARAAPAPRETRSGRSKRS